MQNILWLRMLVCINEQCLQAIYSMAEHTCLRMRAFIAGGTLVARSANSLPSNAYRLPTYMHINPAVRHAKGTCCLQPAKIESSAFSSLNTRLSKALGPE